jgi:dTMP kinase
MGLTAGRFVVLEGIDGSGTTTQVARLADRLRVGRVPVRATREPSDGPVGTLVRQVLTGRVIVPGGRAPGWATMALLFAADRMDHVESEIEPFLASGGVVLSDRYDASSLAYQSVSSGAEARDAVEWIRSLNRYVRRPDLTLVLDLP